MNEIDEIRDKIDLVELINTHGVSLRKAGRNYVGFCPFHPNSRTPAFTVFPDTQSFYCFGCQASGTAFDFLMRKQGLDFPTALEQLAARAGVKLKPRTEQARAEDARRTKLLEINAAAAKYFNYVLRELKRGEPARAYVAHRAINDAMVDAFQLGYSLDDWGHLFTYLTEKKGYAPEDVEASGLAIHHENRGYYDRFRGRLIFPIRNAKGEVVGFGGRALGDGTPKYLNTPETLIYKKGELLYGLDLAREAIRVADCTVVVEGYIDVITAHQHGFRNVVAPLGTALTRGHVGLLKRLSHQVYLALDADAAGQRATLKGLNTLRESADEEGGHLVTTAQGAVRLESDVALRIIRMPEGRDPDEVIRSDPDLWQNLVTSAVPVMEFYLSAYTAGLDLTRPEDQRQALDRLLPLLKELDGTQQRVYIARIEHVVGIRAELILDLLKGKVDRPTNRRPAGKGQPDRVRPGIQVRAIPTPPPDDAPHPATSAEETEGRQPQRRPGSPTEAFLLTLALRHPTVEAAVEALLEASNLHQPALREIFGTGIEDLLENPIHKEIWRHYATLPIEWRPTNADDLTRWIDGLDEALRSTASALLAAHQRTAEDFRYRQEAEHCARSLRIEQVRRMQQHLLQRIKDEQDPRLHNDMLGRFSALTAFLATTTTPRRSSTYPDLRDTLGKE
ncbi:DNA primase [Candidatus Chloroploca asiatica]|uniref:DNA primase n=1 Tax=Candidatus Chloroploca asiatica TaxID=1506545 RepID=A0A2H3KQG6_9CHLR|nr:DNA primase [Candidatus Chloroploca asiatica]PDW00634.1 DNA primase [Candidatus Chloroploca asiatica]